MQRYSRIADVYRLERPRRLVPLVPFMSRSAVAVAAQRNQRPYLIGGDSAFRVETYYDCRGPAQPADDVIALTIRRDPGNSDRDALVRVVVGHRVMDALASGAEACYLRVAVLDAAPPMFSCNYYVAVVPDAERCSGLARNELLLRPFNWDAYVRQRTLTVVLRLRFSAATGRYAVVGADRQPPPNTNRDRTPFGASVMHYLTSARLSLAVAAGAAVHTAALVAVSWPDFSVADVVDAPAAIDGDDIAEQAWALDAPPAVAPGLYTEPTLVLGDVSPVSADVRMAGAGADAWRRLEIDYAMVVLVPEFAGAPDRRAPAQYVGLALEYTADGVLSSAPCPQLRYDGGGLGSDLFQIVE